jgi:hypothetical protein
MKLPSSAESEQLILPGLETHAELPDQVSLVPALHKQSWVTYCYDIDWSLLDSLDPDHPPVILSYGMGVDSTAMLLRFLFEPDCRDFPLRNLVVIIAMTGDEWDSTAALVRRFILPLCRRFGIWVIQVSRHGEHERDGITIHSSTRCPTRLYIEGDYKLSQHLLLNGIVPQKAKGKRFCTMKFKAFPIDFVVKLFFGDSPAVRYRRMIGFNAGEKDRAANDHSYGTQSKPRYLVGYSADEVKRAQQDSSLTTAQHYRYLLGFNANEVERQKAEASTWRNQVFEFPLIRWNWSREQCLRYSAEITYLLELSEQVWVELERPLDDTAINAEEPAALNEQVVSSTWWDKSCCEYGCVAKTGGW